MPLNITCPSCCAVRHAALPAGSAGAHSRHVLPAGVQLVLLSDPWTGQLLQGALPSLPLDAKAEGVLRGTAVTGMHAIFHSLNHVPHMQALRRFGAFRRIRLQPPLPIESLALAALEAQEALGRWQV